MPIGVLPPNPILPFPGPPIPAIPISLHSNTIKPTHGPLPITHPPTHHTLPYTIQFPIDKLSNLDNLIICYNET